MTEIEILENLRGRTITGVHVIRRLAEAQDVATVVNLTFGDGVVLSIKADRWTDKPCQPCLTIRYVEITAR